MAKVHITLLGGQTIPVTKCILDDKPEMVIMICSQQTKASAEIIKKIVLEELENVIFESPVFDPSDPKKINPQIIEIAKKINNDSDITINLTGGTKHWSLLFYKYFLNYPNVKFILLDQNDNIYDINNDKHENIKRRFNIEQTMQLNGIHVEQGQDITSYDKEDQNVLKLIKEMRKFSPAQFNTLVMYMCKHTNETIFKANDGNYLEWDTKTKTFTCKMTKKFGKRKTWTLKSPKVRTLLLNTGWFEYEVATLLKRWQPQSQIILNCKLKRKANMTGNILNEIDIIVQTDTKLLFVECKTQVSEATDVDKFNNAVRNYGGLGAKRVFFTLAKMQGMAKEKCEQAKIPFFCVEEMKTEKDVKNVFEILNSYMGTLNER